MTPLSDLTSYAGNARTHTDAQIAQIAATIKEFGFTNPILAGSDGVIIAGHGWLLAPERLGMDKEPVITLDYLDEAQHRALVIANNKIAENGGWDEELLQAELADLLGDLEAEALGEVDGKDDVPEAPEGPVSRPGDLWLLGNYWLLCGDSTVANDVERVLGTVKPLLMVPDLVSPRTRSALRKPSACLSVL